MKKYRYFMCGMFDGTDGNTYDICIPSPFARDSKSEAMKDERFAYRFASFDAEGPLLIVFDEEYFEAAEENGKKELRCWVSKNVIAKYSFAGFKKNGGYIRQLKQEAKGKFIIDDSDFIETDKTFADVFPNIEQGKLYYVDDESYSVEEVTEG